jgi:membrane protein implicated in regulation of membrane protease activity
MTDNVLQHWHDAIGVLGLALLAASYMSADTRAFRLWSVGAFAVGAIYFILVPEGSNWVGVLAMAVYGAINLVLFARTRRAKAEAKKTAAAPQA